MVTRRLNVAAAPSLPSRRLLQSSCRRLFSASPQLRAPAGANPTLSILSWAVDSEEKSGGGAKRWVSFPDRIPGIVNAILTSNADVVVLQDSKQVLGEAVEAAKHSPYLWVDRCGVRVRPGGDLQLFVRGDGDWKAVIERHLNFLTFSLSHQTYRDFKLRMSNIALFSLGEDVPNGPSKEVRRGRMVSYLTDVAQAQIVAGMFALRGNEHISEYSDSAVDFGKGLPPAYTSDLWVTENQTMEGHSASSSNKGSTMDYYLTKQNRFPRRLRHQRLLFRPELGCTVVDSQVLRPTIEVASLREDHFARKLRSTQPANQSGGEGGEGTREVRPVPDWVSCSSSFPLLTTLAFPKEKLLH
jgi:hypothetical protein